MKTTSLTPNLIQLTRWPKGFPINVYLVREDDGLTLIDAAIRGTEKEILSAANAAGAPIRRIVLTHCHNDHVGALPRLRKALPDAEVLMHPRTAEILGNKGQPDRTIDDGDIISSLQVVFSPGHSPDQIAFLDTRDQALIAGDAYVTQGGTVVAGTIRWVFPFPSLFTSDKSLALETAIMLRALNPTLLAVGHGKALADPLIQMDNAIAEARRKQGRQATGDS